MCIGVGFEMSSTLAKIRQVCIVNKSQIKYFYLGCPAAALDLTQMLLGTTYLLYSAVGHGAASVFPSLYKVY